MTTIEIQKWYDSRSNEVREIYLRGTEKLWDAHAKSLGYDKYPTQFIASRRFASLPKAIKDKVSRMIAAM